MKVKSTMVLTYDLNFLEIDSDKENVSCYDYFEVRIKADFEEMNFCGYNPFSTEELTDYILTMIEGSSTFYSDAAKKVMGKLFDKVSFWNSVETVVKNYIGANGVSNLTKLGKNATYLMSVAIVRSELGIEDCYGM